MTTPSLRATTFLGWPAWTLGQGPLALQVVPAVGGRLMGIQVAGTELCFINPALAGRLPVEDPAVWRQLCGEWSFPLWGGGKTWVAPESAWPDGSPHRDLDSGAYRLVRTWCDGASAGLELESPVCRQTGLQIQRRISLSEDAPGWTVRHTLGNTSAAPVTCGIWDVLMLRRPGRVAAALDDPQAGFDRFRAIAGQGDLAELRRQGILDAQAGQLTVQCRQARQYKIGVAGATGHLQVRLELPEGPFRYWRAAPAPAGASYAHGHPVEVFNAPELPYFEVESHAPLATLAPGASVSWTVREGAEPD
jgi:hypothetical protein